MCSKVEIDIDDNSLENSADSELIGMVDEGSFGSSDDKTGIVPQSYLTQEEPNQQYQLRDISGSITYKIVQMSTSDPYPSNVATNSPSHIVGPDGEYFVISNPVEVFGSTTVQKKVNRRDPMEVKVATAKKRDDKRRATHNEVERRRRDKINSWITKLAALVPNSGLPDSASKGGILAKACDHITELTEKQKRLEKLEVENEKLILEVLRLNQELTDLRKENSSMRNQLADNCIVYSHRSKGQKS